MTSRLSILISLAAALAVMLPSQRLAAADTGVPVQLAATKEEPLKLNCKSFLPVGELRGSFLSAPSKKQEEEQRQACKKAKSKTDYFHIGDSLACQPFKPMATVLFGVIRPPTGLEEAAQRLECAKRQQQAGKGEMHWAEALKCRPFKPVRVLMDKSTGKTRWPTATEIAAQRQECELLLLTGGENKMVWARPLRCDPFHPVWVRQGSEVRAPTEAEIAQQLKECRIEDLPPPVVVAQSVIARAPGTPTPDGPANGTVIEAVGGRMITTRGERADVVFSFTPYDPDSDPANPVGEPTRYRICVYNPPGGSLCDQITVPWADLPDVVRFGFSNSGQTEYEVPFWGLRDLRPTQPAPPGRKSLLQISWKIQACNDAGCSDWSAPRSLTWLPYPRLLSPAPATEWPDWQHGTTILRAQRIEGVSTYLFLITTELREWSNWPTIDNGSIINDNEPPFVVEIDRTPGQVADPDWDPWYRVVRQLPVTGGSGPQEVWYVDPEYSPTVFPGFLLWSAAACVDLPTGGKGCVYNWIPWLLDTAH